MIGFIVGLFVGAFLGVVVMCCCFVASKADDEMTAIIQTRSDKYGRTEKYNRNKNDFF